MKLLTTPGIRITINTTLSGVFVSFCPRYRENMKEFVKLSIDWPMSGIEETVWWTEYVLRHNNTEHLKGAARKVSIYQYYLLDVIGGVTLAVLVITYLSIKLVKYIWKSISTNVITKFHKD